MDNLEKDISKRSTRQSFVSDLLVQSLEGELSVLLSECLNSSLREQVSKARTKGGLSKWFTARCIRGYFARRLEERNGHRTKILQNAGLKLIEVENPLHILSAFHPSRSIRLASLKLARKLDINITEVCNFKCSYCYQRSRDDDWQIQADKAELAQLGTNEWIRLLDEAATLGVNRVKFTGGEPFTKPQFFEVLSHAFSLSDLEEIEVCTNCSLLKGARLERLKSIVGSGERLHFHVSVDGFDKSSDRRAQEKIFSEENFAHLEAVLSGLPEATFSVNTMWTSALNEEALIGIHNKLARMRPLRWSISLPYLVRDVVDAVRSGSFALPSFDQIIEFSSELIKIHHADGSPYPLSIPLVWKHESVSEEFDLSSAIPDNDTIDHPCFPCHGSYFIVGPKGNMFDCLLLSRSQATLAGNSLASSIRAVGSNNDWYDLSIKSVSGPCQGCRYESICQGQCPNDRWNGSSGTSFGRDLSACSLLVRSERTVWSTLSKEEKQSLEKRINQDGFFPATWRSLEDIIAGKPPISVDEYADGRLTGNHAHAYGVNVSFHEAPQRKQK